MSPQKRTIGVFDSGFGGLDIFREIVTALPEYAYMYLADSARAPYGSKSKEEVLVCTTEGVEFLFSRGAELVILACNTSSSDALRIIQQTVLPVKYPDRNVLGVVIPAAEEAVAQSVTGRIGVMGTEQTIASKSFEKELHKLRPEVEVYAVACPKLVPLIEQGMHDSPELRTTLHEYLTPLLSHDIDTLILGCTHYGLIKEAISSIVGPHIHVLSEASILPRKLEDYLTHHPEYRDHLATDGTVSFFTTDTTDRFERLGAQFYGGEIQAEHVTLPG
jgi:glutamate racemase